MLRDNPLLQKVAILQRCLRSVEGSLEFGIRLLRKAFSRDGERTHRFTSHVITFLVQPVIELDNLGHDNVSSFLIEGDLIGGLIAYYDAHPLGLACEWEDLEDRELIYVSTRSAQMNLVHVAEY